MHFAYLGLVLIPLTQIFFSGRRWLARGPKTADSKINTRLAVTRSSLLHFLSWSFWLAAVAYVAPALSNTVATLLRVDRHTMHLGSLVTSIVGEALMVKSLLTFDSETQGPRASERERGRRSLAVIILGTLLSFLGGGLLVYASTFSKNESLALIYFLAAVCGLVGANTTHGLGGYLLWSFTPSAPHPAAATTAREPSQDEGTDSAETDRERSVTPGDATAASQSSPSSAWAFFQPFRGGKVFVSVQILGWMFFGFALSGLLWLLYSPSGRLALGTAASLVLGQMAIAASLRYFVAVPDTVAVTAATAAALRPADRASYIPEGLTAPPTLWDKANATLLMALLYLPVHIVVTFYVVTFMIFPFKIFVAMHAAHLAPYLAFSGALALKQSRHDPYHTGSRAWPLMQRWANKYMTLMADLWLGGSKVIYDGPGDRIRLPATCDRVIYGFHPHGLYPVAAGLLPFFPAFERVAPEGPRPITLTADAMYFPPVLRDVMGWSGARRVSRATFKLALEDHKGVVLVPGGQQELVYAYRAHQKVKQPEVVVCTKHRGFIRMALESNAALVPCLCLNEIYGVWNAIEWPSLQAWTYKKVGFPIPFLLTGRFPLMFVPKPHATGATVHPLTFVLGEPLLPPTATSAVPPTPVKENALPSTVGAFPLENVLSSLDPSPAPTPVKGTAAGGRGAPGGAAPETPSHSLNNRGSGRKEGARPSHAHGHTHGHTHGHGHGVRYVQGTTIEVTDELVERYHAEYYRRVQQLWDHHAADWGNGHAKLTLLCK